MVLYTAAIHALSNSQSFGFKLGTTEGFERFFFWGKNQWKVHCKTYRTNVVSVLLMHKSRGLII